MREILFKAKRKDNDEWVYGYPMRHPQAVQVGPYEPFWTMFAPPADPEDTGGVFEIDPDTLCQYTGLKDKNGNRIWENDICVLHTNSIDEEDGYFKVEYGKDNAGFVFLGVALQFDFEFIRDDECEVVGTIFEHPELQEYLRRYL